MRTLAAGIVVLFAGAALAQNVDPPTAGDYVDPASGMTYPVSVGAFQRIEVGRNDEGAVVAVYRKGAEDLTVTVSVFKTSTVFVLLGMPKDRKEIDKAYCMDTIHRVANEGAEDVVQTNDSDATLKYGWSSKDGFKRSYSLKRDFLDRKKVALHSDIYRFCNIDKVWTVQYRVDYPAGSDPSKDVKAFMKDLDWTIAAKR
jgi:hypothetical protein